MQDLYFDGDPNGIVRGEQGDRCTHTSRNVTYVKTGGAGLDGWQEMVTTTTVGGASVQSQFVFVDTLKSSPLVVPMGDVAATSSQGSLLLTKDFTPRYANSLIHLTFSCTWSFNIASQDAAIFFICRSDQTDCIAQAQYSTDAGGALRPCFLQWLDKLTGQGPVTYSVRFGCGVTASGPVTINGPVSGRRGGGKQRAVFVMKEIKQ